MSFIDIFESGDKNKIFGVVIGIVTNNQDDDGMGRVKVKFPWREESDESYWARIATPMAGKDRGIYFLPEVGDEVLVSFDHGNIYHPYILGSLWNGQDSPPEKNSDGKNGIRKIKSRSGHQIIFDDSDGKEKLGIFTKSGHSIILDDSSGSEKIEIKDNNGNLLAFDSLQNSINISSISKITLEGPMIDIKAESILTLKGGQVLIN